MATGKPYQIPAKVMDHLQGLHFPTSKSKLIENARQELGPDSNEVINLFSKLKKEEYNSPAELMHEVGKMD